MNNEVNDQTSWEVGLWIEIRVILVKMFLQVIIWCGSEIFVKELICVEEIILQYF